MELDETAILWSAPPAERAGRPLMLLLHGFGSNERDLFDLAPLLPSDYVVASLRAPTRSGGGWTWFAVNPTVAGDPDPAVASAAAKLVLEWLDSQSHPTVSLLGFSQGGALALQMLRHAPARFESILFLSSFVTRGEVDGDAELVISRPPVFWGRGDADTRLPDAAIERTAAWLPGHTDLTARVYPNMGHSISQQELADINAFLAVRR